MKPNRVIGRFLIVTLLPIPKIFALPNHTCPKAALARLVPQSNAKTFPIPIGLSQQQHERLNTFLKSSMAKNGPELIFLYGSRTHFTYGHEPTAESDLDVFPIYANGTAEERVDAHFRFAEDLAKTFADVGFPLKAQLPYGGDTKEFLWAPVGETPLLPAKTISEQKEEWNRIKLLSATQGWDRERTKLEYILAQAKLEGGAMHREAIIYVRESPNASKYEQRLRELGFTNILRVREQP